MAWGIPLAAFTFVHVLLSLIGIGAGVVVMALMLSGQERRGWTALFLVTTIATSVTGFGFPVDRLLPAHVVGFISLVVLTVALVARYGRRLGGGWGRIYVVCAALALYLNVLVGVVQAFLRVPVLHAMAPRQTDPPFVVAQLVVLAVFIALTIVAVRRFPTASPACA